jgi:UDPglucose 6-dehydrogenase
MKITMIGGVGYVGLVSGACLADLGNDVICTGRDQSKIDNLMKGISPIYEPGLEEVLDRNIKAGRLSFTTNNTEAVQAADIIFLTVGTPSAADGSADLSQIDTASREVAEAMKSDPNQRYRIIVNKSTVPIGTGDRVMATIKEIYNGEFDVVSNPEFLREGSAVGDFSIPDRVVLGSDSVKARDIMNELYLAQNAPILHTNIKTAEMIKYASNSYLATSISFINALAQLCEVVGADVTKVAEGMRYDARIGKRAFLDAGVGYGGACFPKDVKALVHIGQENGVPLRILEEVEATNQRQKTFILPKIDELVPDLKGKKVAVWGLAFKPNTDDMREAPSLEIIAALQERGAQVVAFDPVAEEVAKTLIKDIEYVAKPLDVLDGAELLVLVTEWAEFAGIDLDVVKSKMAAPNIVDGRNVYDPIKMKEHGFNYRSIGRA